jgi:hypothetical protein
MQEKLENFRTFAAIDLQCITVRPNNTILIYKLKEGALIICRKNLNKGTQVAHLDYKPN